MENTLSQILSTLFQAHQTIDRLQAELQARDQRIAELEQDGQRQVAEFATRLVALESAQLPTGWRLVKDA